MHLTGIKKDTFLGFESGYDRFPRIQKLNKNDFFKTSCFVLKTVERYISRMKGKCCGGKKI